MRKIFLLALCLVASVTVRGQLPGQNVNMVTGKTFPGGDPWLQKQNEPSGAVSTKNPCHLLAGANDYRAVNLQFPQGLKTDKEIGDAWVGWYASINCGDTWYSTLIPGYPQDTSAVGKSSPVYGLTTAGDPTVRAGAGGIFYYSYMVNNRGTNVGKLAVSRFVDRNTSEFVKSAENAISYIDTKVWDTGSAGNFIDKPTLLVTQGSGTCTVTTAAGKTATIPASTVHLAWTVFVGNNDDVIRTKVYYARSSNCGTTLDGPPTKLSEGYAVTQSATIAQAANGAIYVVWRQFATPKGDVNQLLVAKSVDGGKSFTKGSPIPMPLSFMPFDQGTSRKTFRTNAFAAIAPDPYGRLYVAIAVRGYANANQSRVVVMNTLDGVLWNGPFAIDNDPNAPGHQIMPAITSVGGKLNAVWLDFHDDVSGKFGYGLFDTFIKEVYPIRHSMDVRGAQATLQQNGTLNWTKYGILQDAVPQATVPRISRYLVGDYNDANGDHFFKQLQFNRSNLKLYAGGTVPFIGDFIDVAGLAYLAQQNGQTTTWLPNNGLDPLAFTTAAQTFYAFWTDNRDAKVSTFPQEPDTDAEDGVALPYMAPGTSSCTGTNPPTKTRNANVYMSRITPGLFVAAPTNSKPSIIGNNSANRIVRAFPVFVQNNTGNLRTFRLTIVPPAQFPAAGIATFQQIPQNPIPSPLPVPVLTVDVTIPPKSSITRTVSVVSSIKFPQIRVNVVEVTNTNPLTGSAIINADIENADIENADIENADIENQEIHNADIENADIENADIENADIENADIENADIENADIENADIENADIENADIENADIENADIENADIENGAVTDFSVDLDNTGNTASSYQVKFAVGANSSGYVFQLIGRRAYKTPSAHGCEQIEKTTNQILFNIPNPDTSPTPLPDQTSSDAGAASQATILVGPRETLKLTLRAFDKDGINNRTGGDGSIKPFCPIVDMNGANCNAVTNPVTVIVRAASPNTGSNEAFEEVVTTNPDGGVTVTTTTLPVATAGTTYSQQLAAVGGLGSYTWSVVSGALPPGLSLSTTSGLISGNATAVGFYNFVVRATDGIQSDTQALTIQVVASITTASVPGAIIGTLYGPRTLQQAGLSGPLTWTVQSGSLPAGVTLNSSTGTLGGIATTPGVANFVVQVQDAASNAATRAFSITAMVIDAGDLIVADGAVLATSGSVYRVTPGGAVTLIASLTGSPEGIAQDRNSFVLVDRTNNSVLRVTPGNVETLHTASGPAGYVAVAVTHAGDIIIGDNAADKVYKLTGSTLTTLGNLPSSPTELQNVSIAIEPNGGVMVADDSAQTGATVQLVHFNDVTGAQPPTIVTTTVVSAGAIALHSSGDFLLADYQNGQQIVRVTSGGSTVGSPIPSGSGLNVVGLAVDFDESIYTVSNFTAEMRHITTQGTSTQVTSGSPFVFMNDLVHFRPADTFEFFVDGTPACASCAVTNEFAPLGTTFSFVTIIPNTGVTNVSLSGPNLFDHPSEGNNHTITAPTLPSGGWYNGTMTITTPGPQTVTFRVQGNNTITTFPISAVDGQGNQIAIQRRNVFTYGVGALTAREETIVITSPAGIATITVDMPVGLLFVDDFVVTLPPVIIP